MQTPPAAPPRVFVVHGYQAAPDRHWFPWLTGRLTAHGFAVTVIALPDSASPERQAWADAVGAAVGRVDADTWFVGHSLGCVTVLRYLAARTDDWSAAGVVLVAGFDGPLADLPELDGYLAPAPSARAVRAVAHRVGVRLMVRSDHDEFVPAAASDALAARFDAPVTVMPGAGHFMGSDGIVELDVVLAAVLGTPPA